MKTKKNWSLYPKYCIGTIITLCNLMFLLYKTIVKPEQTLTRSPLSQMYNINISIKNRGYVLIIQ